ILTLTGFVGGAIYNEGDLDIVNTVFASNTANNNAGGGEGGAIYNSLTATMTITQAKFSSNSAHYGGAIVNWGTLEIGQSTFNSSTAVEEGGAIINSGILNVLETSFNNNTSTTLNGGGLFNDGSMTI
ncbi:MAG TPA: hypothetical protein VHL11_20015, partial [Phototrophicaceae bacterium]|nr:hypothetical protein [Phototrophicaceae bacterium]